ncbi:MAG TPA: porin family protein [Dehalococcoidia bacterium]|nr:porin family protein [Dehalococcoidia bacterium]
MGAAVIIVAAAASVASAQGAQAVVASRPTFGIMVGGNFAKLSGDDAGDVDRRTGFMGGVYADLPVGTSGVSIQPRVLYSMDGAKLNNLDGNGTDATLKTNYIRVPVMVRYTIPTSGAVRPFFSLGPSFGLQIGCKVSADNSGVSASLTCDDLNGQVGGFEKKTFDMAGDIEFGLEFPTGSKSFTVGGIFSQGFTDTFTDVKAHNQGLSVYVGLGF